jgi:hypothetical protein
MVNSYAVPYLSPYASKENTIRFSHSFGDKKGTVCRSIAALMRYINCKLLEGIEKSLFFWFICPNLRKRTSASYFVTVPGDIIKRFVCA